MTTYAGGTNETPVLISDEKSAYRYFYTEIIEKLFQRQLITEKEYDMTQRKINTDDITWLKSIEKLFKSIPETEFKFIHNDYVITRKPEIRFNDEHIIQIFKVKKTD